MFLFAIVPSKMGLNPHNNIALAKAAKCNIISFKASEKLTKVRA